MRKFTIGILRETKNPPDKRVAITPQIAVELQKKYPEIELLVQPSDLRCFKDQEYTKLGIKLQEDLSDCDILVGVKEVDKSTFIANKTYMFFAHVAKKQPYNREMLQTMMQKSITLIDYEYLTRKNGSRVVAFGRWAGIVGAYNGLRARGLKTGYFNLKPAHQYNSMAEMFKDLDSIIFKNIKIVITGGGRVASGAMETLNAAGIKKVSPQEFLTKTYNEIVYTQLEPWDYVARKDENEFKLEHFFNHPSEYKSTFEPYTKVADIFIPCHFWDPESPVFFTKEQLKSPEFNISVIADVSCDIAIPVPTTLRPSTIAEPFYDIDKNTCTEDEAFKNDNTVTVMAIDNLPGELPRDASDDFSQNLFDNIFDYIIKDDVNGVINRATIIENGKLTKLYSYLENYALGKE